MDRKEGYGKFEFANGNKFKVSLEFCTEFLSLSSFFKHMQYNSSKFNSKPWSAINILKKRSSGRE